MPPKDIRTAPQAVRDFIHRQGMSLNPLTIHASYRLPQDSKACEPKKTRQRYCIEAEGQTQAGQAYADTDKLPLSQPGQVHYRVGEAIDEDTWCDALDQLQQGCDDLLRALSQADNHVPWPERVQPLHLIHSNILIPVTCFIEYALR